MFSARVSFTYFSCKTPHFGRQMCCCFLYWSWVFTHSWKAFLRTLLTEGFTCVCFWYLYIEASYFQSFDLVSLFFCLVWEMDLILSFSKQWSTRLASFYLTDHDCCGELKRVLHHSPGSSTTMSVAPPCHQPTVSRRSLQGVVMPTPSPSSSPPSAILACLFFHTNVSINRVAPWKNAHWNFY